MTSSKLLLVVTVTLALLSATACANDEVVKSPERAKHENPKIQDARGKMIAFSAYVAQRDFISFLSERLSIMQIKLSAGECLDVSDVLENSVTLRMIDYPKEACSLNDIEVFEKYVATETTVLSMKFQSEINELKDRDPLSAIDDHAALLTSARGPSALVHKYFPMSDNNVKYLRISGYILIGFGFAFAILAIAVSVHRQNTQRRAAREAQSFEHAQLNMILVKDV